MDNIKMDRILTKIFYIAFQVLKVHLIKISNGYSNQIFYFLLFLLAFTSAYIIFTSFQNLIQHYLKKRFSSQIFLQRTHSTPPSKLLYSQNQLRVPIFFCQCSITYHNFSRLLCYHDARKYQNSRAELILQQGRKNQAHAPVMRLPRS